MRGKNSNSQAGRCFKITTITRTYLRTHDDVGRLVSSHTVVRSVKLKDRQIRKHGILGACRIRDRRFA